MRRRSIGSLSVPIVLASIGVPLSIALLVGWTLLVVKSQALPENVWLLVMGALAFVVIMAVLVIFSIFLVREVLEVRRQASFIDSVTHELKSPLASLKLCLETLARSELHQDQREQLRRMMLDDVERLSSFIDDVLQASRLSHDRVGVHVTEVNLRDLVERVVSSVAIRTKVDQECVRVEVDPGFMVRTDPAALAIVLKNLIDNAFKYSEGEPDVVIRARAEGERVHVAVEDRGIGLDAKHLKRIFHRFYRVNSESVRARRGTGLGLFVVSALVRNLGGRIEATSRGQGRGTTMHVSLPAAPAAQTSDERTRSAPAGDAAEVGR